MKINAKTFLLFTVLTISLFNCKKKTDEPAPDEEPAPVTPAPTGINTIAEVFTSNGAPTQVFTVSTGSASTITVNGVKIEIPANAFVTPSNGTITGNVEVSVRTILNKSEIILSGAGANSTSSKLVSTKGCVKMTASQNTQQLRTSSGNGTVTVGIPETAAIAPPPQKKYYASKISASDSTKVWALGTDVSNIPVVFDNATSKYYHKAALDSLKWLNVGVQYDSIGAPKTAVTASVNSSQFSKTNTAVYLSLNGSLTVGAMFEISPGIFRISNIPTGKAANIVAIAVINGQYYLAIQPVTASATTINLNLQAVTFSQIQTQLATLP